MQKPEKTFADYLVVAISPVLIMLLVGSLAFFLIQVFYQNEMIEGVRWVLFWFVFAIVLVARVGIEQSKGHAVFYGVALAIVTWVYLTYSHKAPMVAAVLLAVTWWCAHKLTVDCTLVNEEEDASGESVLHDLWRAVEESLQESGTLPKTRKVFPDLPPGVELKKRVKPARRPGRWVIYFSLAALPLFGIGQLLLPADQPELRRTGFLFLAVYLAAALSLLITTSFLGMRRYLRQRFVEMSSSIAFGWVRFGVLLAAGILIVAMLIPRPGWSAWRTLTNRMGFKTHKASDYALPFNPPGEGDGTVSDHQNEKPQAGAESKKAPAGSGTQVAQNTSNHSNNRNDSTPSSSGSGGGQSSGGNSGGGGGGESGGGAGAGNSTPSGNSGNVAMSDHTPAGDDSGEHPGPTKAEDDGKDPELRDGNGSSKPKQTANNSQRTQSSQKKQNAAQAPEAEQKQVEQPPPQPQGKEQRKIDFRRWLRILVLLALAAVLVWLIIRYRQKIAQAIRAFVVSVREFFRNLFRFRRRKAKVEEEVPPPVFVPEPFAAYENPFLTGKDKTWAPEKLVLYTYEVLQGWGKEQGIGLKPEETPREYCMRLSEHFPDFGPELERFSFFYSHAAFARELPEDFETESIRHLWEYMGDSVAVVA